MRTPALLRIAFGNFNHESKAAWQMMLPPCRQTIFFSSFFLSSFLFRLLCRAVRSLEIGESSLDASSPHTATAPFSSRWAYTIRSDYILFIVNSCSAHQQTDELSLRRSQCFSSIRELVTVRGRASQEKKQKKIGKQNTTKTKEQNQTKGLHIETKPERAEGRKIIEINVHNGRSEGE